MARPMFLLVLFACMCMCCNSSRIKRLENRVSRIEGRAVFHNDLEDIDKKMEALNSSVAQCFDPERVIPAIKIDIADNRHAIVKIKTDVKSTGHAIANVKKSIGSVESTVRQVSDDVVHKVNKVEMSTYVDSSVDELKTYVDNSIKALKDEILKALRDSVTRFPQTTTLKTVQIPDQTTTSTTTETPDQTTTSATTQAPDQTTTLATTQAPDRTTTLATTQAPDQTTIPTTTSPVKLPSCLEHLLFNGERQSGVYTIYPLPSHQPVRVYCDMDTDGGGWTVFQRLQDGSVNFYRTWADYASGFGNVSGEFWLGNDLISLLTSRSPHELRIDMIDYANHSIFAKYGTFKVSPSATNYTLEVGEFSGDAGDSLSNHSGMEFSTIDRDNDKRVKTDSRFNDTNCAESYRGAWWYHNCADSNLNGFYHRPSLHGVWWGYIWPWPRNVYRNLRWTEMKLRGTPQLRPIF